MNYDKPSHREVLPSYLSEDNRRVLLSLNFNTKDIWHCWKSHPETAKIKGKCTACGMETRIPPYLIKFNKQCNYQKDPDKPHAMFIYAKTLAEMEEINPQKIQYTTTNQKTTITTVNMEDGSNNIGDMDTMEDTYDDGQQSAKRVARMPEVDLIRAMEMLETTIEKAKSRERGKLLVPVCFECYLRAIEEVERDGYRMPSIYNVPELEEKKKSIHHSKISELSGVELGIIILERLHNRLGWCTLSGSRHCINVKKVGKDGKGGYKVCGKRRCAIRPETMKGELMRNDYYCLEHRDGHTDVEPPSKYYGMFRNLPAF